MVSPTRGSSSPTSAGYSRRDALRVLGAASSLPFLTAASAAAFSGALGWQPKCLSPRAAKTVERLVESVLAQVETPGVEHAGIHEYIDLVLSRSDESVRTRFEEGLSWLDAYSRQSRRRNFADLSRRERRSLLEEISDTSANHEPDGYRFLTEVKQLTIEGYYRFS